MCSSSTGGQTWSEARLVRGNGRFDEFTREISERSRAGRRGEYEDVTFVRRRRASSGGSESNCSADIAYLTALELDELTRV
jgi:hypothetical protein